MSHSPLYSEHLTQCLAHSKCSIVSWMFLHNFFFLPTMKTDQALFKKYNKTGDSETKEGLRIGEAAGGSLGYALLWPPRNIMGKR